MNKSKKVINILIPLIIMVLTIVPTSAFDFSTDTNFYKFTEGYRNYVTPVKDKEVVWSESGKLNTNFMDVLKNGTTLAELRSLTRIGNLDLETFKHSDGTSYMICTGKHDVTGHTIVVMIEPKNNLAYVYDTDSYTSEVVNLGEYVQIYNGRTLVPLRKFTGIFGWKIKYYGRANYDII